MNSNDSLWENFKSRANGERTVPGLVSWGVGGSQGLGKTKPPTSVPEGFWFFKAFQFCTRTPESLDFSPGSQNGIRRRLSQRGDVWLTFCSTLAMFIFGILQKEVSQHSSEIYKDTTGDLLTWSCLLVTQLKHYTLIKRRGHIFLACKLPWSICTSD